MDTNPTHLQQPSPSLALSTANSVPSGWKRTRVNRPVQHCGRAIRPGKAGPPSSISAEEGEEQQQQIISTRRKKGLRLHASIAHLRTQPASADGPPDTIARDLDEIRGSPTPLAPRRRQKPRMTVNGARRDLFRRDTTATASAACPSTLTLPRTHLADRPEVPPSSRRRSGRRREREPAASPVARKGNPRRLLDRLVRSNFSGSETSAERTLDAPELIDDYYLNLMEWGSSNLLSIALGDTMYPWDASSGSTSELVTVEEENGSITSVSWAPDGRHLAIRLNSSDIQL